MVEVGCVIVCGELYICMFVCEFVGGDLCGLGLLVRGLCLSCWAL